MRKKKTLNRINAGLYTRETFWGVYTIKRIGYPEFQSLPYSNVNWLVSFKHHIASNKVINFTETVMPSYIAAKHFVLGQ